MGTRLKIAIIGVLACLALAMPLLARADGDRDHDRARDLHEGGEIRALSEILRNVNRQVPGDIVAVDLVRAHDKWVYRIQIVSPAGRRVTVEVDAGAGTVFRDQEGDE